MNNKKMALVALLYGLLVLNAVGVVSRYGLTLFPRNSPVRLMIPFLVLILCGIAVAYVLRKRMKHPYATALVGTFAGYGTTHLVSLPSFVMHPLVYWAAALLVFVAMWFISLRFFESSRHTFKTNVAIAMSFTAAWYIFCAAVGQYLDALFYLDYMMAR